MSKLNNYIRMPLGRRGLAAVAASVVSLAMALPAAAEPTKFEFWYGVTGPLSDTVQQMCTNFNKSQSDFQIVCVSHGDYAQNFQDLIAAYRANKQPTLGQENEITTGTMLLSGAVVPAQKMITDAGYKIDWNNYLPAVRAYYQTSKGELYSMPFNSSTAVLYWNQDAFAKIGKDKAPATWEEAHDDAVALKKAGYDCPIALDISSDAVWQDMEQFLFAHGEPVATKDNGYNGLDAQVVFNKSAKFVKFISDLKAWTDEGTVVLKNAKAGESTTAAFAAGHCQMEFESVASHSGIGKTAAPDMHWSTAVLPIYAGTERHNAVVGGASIWVLKGKSEAEYKGAAAFLNWLSQPEQALFWSTNTGYIPVTKTGYDYLVKSGFYDKAPYKGREAAIHALNDSKPAQYGGIRLLSMPQIRVEVGNAFAAIFSGKTPVQQALDEAAQRSNDDLAKAAAPYKGQAFP
jgi:sn-glycerol 3-phosphate transport system substrate-binding protein